MIEELMYWMFIEDGKNHDCWEDYNNEEDEANENDKEEKIDMSWEE